MLLALVVSASVIIYSAVVALFLANLEKPNAEAAPVLEAVAIERAFRTRHLLDERAAFDEDMRRVA